MAPERTVRSGGFSLLEVMVALFIFAMAAVVLGSAYVNILNSYVAVGKGTGGDQDLEFARQKLLTQPDLNAAEAGEEYDTADVPGQTGLAAQSAHHVKWTADIQQATLPDLFTVTLTCAVTTPAFGVEPRTTTQTFMLLRPTWSDATDRSNLRQAENTRIAQLQGKQPK